MWFVNAILGSVCGFLLSANLIMLDENAFLLLLAMLVSSFLGTTIVFPIAFNSLTFVPEPPISHYRYKTWFWTSIWYGMGCSFIAVPIFRVLVAFIEGNYTWQSVVEGFAAGFMLTFFMFGSIIPMSFVVTTINAWWLDREGLLTP